MKCLFIVITFIMIINLHCSEEIIVESDVIHCYEELCGHIQGDYLSDKFLLDCYSTLSQHKKELSQYLQNLNLSTMDYYDVNSFIIIAGIFKLSDLDEKIRYHHNFDSLLINNKAFYYYQISGSYYYLEILKSYSSLVLKPKDIYFMELKTQAINLLGWTCDKNILNFIKSVNTDGFDGMYGEIYFDSIYRLELFLKQKNN